MAILKPRLVIATGISATGKTTTLEEVTRKILNSLLLDKDVINQAILHVFSTSQGKLLSFEDYVREDTVFPNHARDIQTPFGPAIRIDPKNEFYGRHAREQTYLLMAGIALINLNLGKVPIIDCMVIRQIKDGTLRRFMDQETFQNFPKYLIHFTADEEDLYQRHVGRAELDPEARIRDAKKIASREAFHRFVTEEQPPIPPELSAYEYLLINTSKGTPSDCAQQCVEYIS